MYGITDPDELNETETDGSHETAQRKRQGVSNKRNFDSDALKIKVDGRDELLFILGRDNVRLREWRIQYGALIFPDWCKSELVIGGKDETKDLLRDKIEDLRENKTIAEFFVPQVVNMSFLVGHNCRNLKMIEEKTETFLRPKGSHKTVMIAGQNRSDCEEAKKMLKDLCGNSLVPPETFGKVLTLEPTACSHILLDGNLPRTASVVFMEKSYGYIPPTAQGRHARVLGIEEGQAFLEDTDANRLCLGAPDPDKCMLEGAMQQARPLGSLLQTNSEFIQQCLFMFLNEVRPYKGVIKLSGSYGKFMFVDLIEDVTSVCWRIEEFAYQTLLFNLKRIFSTRCVLMEENIAEKLGGIIEECFILYEFKLHDKSTKCRSSILTAKEVISEDDGTSTFELIHVTADNKKEKEFTKNGDLNCNRYERFTADVVCVDRKVDFQLKLECKEVLHNDSYNTFTEKLLPFEGEGASRQLLFDGDIKDINVMNVVQKGVTVIVVGSVKITLFSCKKGNISRDNNSISFAEAPVMTIEIGSKVWENAFTENFLAAYDEESKTNMTWSAEQLLTKDLEEYMNVMQQASSFIKPQ